MTTTTPTTTAHATFTIERTMKATPQRVYAAFADPQKKLKWFAGDAAKWTPSIRDMDFRVGGRDRLRGQWHQGPESDFQAQYFDIVPNERIVYVYDMYINGHKMSVSLATIEISAVEEGTLVRLTEQGVFFDGMQDAIGREKGTMTLMDAMEKSLAD